jgi:AbrB family looped-hinge helix DNA binding protein
VATATVTSKGQITIPVEVRRKLKIRAGSRLDFIEEKPGEFAIRPQTGRLRDLFGMVETPVHLTLEQMDEAIARGAVDSAGLSR